MKRSKVVIGGFLAVVLLVTSCDSKFAFWNESQASGAEDLIEDDFVEDIGFGPLKAECETPTSFRVGTKFNCTGTTEDSKVLTFEAEIVSGEQTNVTPLDFIPKAEVSQFETSIGSIVRQQNPEGTWSVECGEETLLIENNMVTCDAIQADQTKKAVVTFTNLSEGELTVALE